MSAKETTSQVAELVELPIAGMTCASCATRIGKRLNRLEGVQATVNYATEKASVRLEPGATRSDDLIETVAQAGYRATLSPPRSRCRAGRRRRHGVVAPPPRGLCPALAPGGDAGHGRSRAVRLLAVAVGGVGHPGRALRGMALPSRGVGHNVAVLPLAAAGYLNPLLAGAAIALSSVFVVTTSLRLRRFRSRCSVGCADASVS